MWCLNQRPSIRFSPADFICEYAVEAHANQALELLQYEITVDIAYLTRFRIKLGALRNCELEAP
jgi:hypothetical protein